MDLLSLASDKLRRLADIKDKIESLEKQLAAVAASSSTAIAPRRKNRMSAAGRLAIAAAQKARWAKKKAKSVAKPIVKKVAKRTMSAAARAKIAAAAKARWAKAKEAGKKTL